MLEQTPITTNLQESVPTVFLFHGVTDQRVLGVRNYTGKHIYEAEFIRLLDELSVVGRSCSIAEVAQFVRGNHELPPYSFSLTFDDGFRNNLETAAPLLHDRDFHGTFYVVSGFLDGLSMTWVDRIESAVAATRLRTVTLPPPMGNTFALDDIDARINVMKAIRLFVKATQSIDIEKFADQVCERLEVSGPLLIEGIDYKLTGEQARVLDAEAIFTVGSHSATHAILSRLSGDELRAEVDDSLNVLEKLLGREIETFAFPEGFEGSFNREVLERLRSRGVDSAVTTIMGRNVGGTDPLQIHRVFVA